VRLATAVPFPMQIQCVTDGAGLVVGAAACPE
jgi:hypothetical protein